MIFTCFGNGVVLCPKMARAFSFSDVLTAMALVLTTISISVSARFVKVLRFFVKLKNIKHFSEQLFVFPQNTACPWLWQNVCPMQHAKATTCFLKDVENVKTYRHVAEM